MFSLASVFLATNPVFRIYYLDTATGFSPPTWRGYPAEMIDTPTSPAAAWFLTHGRPHDADLLSWQHSGFQIDGGNRPVPAHHTDGRKRSARHMLRAPFLGRA